MLEAIGLTKRYNGHVALDGLNLTILPGEVLSLLGTNGAGKTTTINYMGVAVSLEARALESGCSFSTRVAKPSSSACASASVAPSRTRAMTVSSPTGGALSSVTER